MTNTGERSRTSYPLHLSHNVSVLIYHYVCPAKYRRMVFDEDVDSELKSVCEEIEKRYDFRFLEIEYFAVAEPPFRLVLSHCLALN